MSVPYRIRAALMSLQDALIFKYPGRINSSSGGQRREIERERPSQFSLFLSFCSQQISSRLIYIAPELSCCALARSSCERESECVSQRKQPATPGALMESSGWPFQLLSRRERGARLLTEECAGERQLPLSFKGKLGNGKFR